MLKIKQNLITTKNNSSEPQLRFVGFKVVLIWILRHGWDYQIKLIFHFIFLTLVQWDAVNSANHHGRANNGLSNGVAALARYFSKDYAHLDKHHKHIPKLLLLFGLLSIKNWLSFWISNETVTNSRYTKNITPFGSWVSKIDPGSKEYWDWETQLWPVLE